MFCMIKQRHSQRLSQWQPSTFVDWQDRDVFAHLHSVPSSVEFSAVHHLWYFERSEVSRQNVDILTGSCLSSLRTVGSVVWCCGLVGCERKLIGMSWHQIKPGSEEGRSTISIFHLQSVLGLPERDARARVGHLCLVGEDYSCPVMSQWQPMIWVSVINQVPIIVYLGSDKPEIDHFTW